MKTKYKFIFGIITLLLLVGVVTSLETTYNPFTGKLDYVNAVTDKWCELVGCSMTGSINMTENDISNVQNLYTVTINATGNVTFEHRCFDSNCTSNSFDNGTCIIEIYGTGTRVEYCKA